MSRNTKYLSGETVSKTPGSPATEAVSADLIQQGISHHRAGRLSKAIGIYEKVIQLTGDHPDAHHLIGLAMLNRRSRKDRQKITYHLKYAINLRPDVAEFHNDLGNACWNQGRIADAETAFQRAVDLKPDFVKAVYNLGNALFMQDRFVEAISAYRRNIDLDSSWIQAYYRMGNCLQYVGRIDEAIKAYDEAIKRRPDLAEARFARSTALLKVGRFVEGWGDYEYRLANGLFDNFLPTGCPLWDGREFGGKTLLLYGEQGLGDVLHFVRYLPMVRKLGGKMILMCDSALHPLFRNSLAIDELLDKRQEKVPNENVIDFQIPLMSLAKILGTTPATIPCRVPYLEVKRSSAATWAQRLDCNRFNVGLAWAGNPAQKDDRHRSCPLSDLAPLADVEGVTYYSLQKGFGAEQLRGFTGSLQLVDFTDELVDFSHTAALMKALDLVITVDTAAAHLAGALGQPVWTMLWYGHCWRYPRNHNQSQWYPTMRLFRQPQIGDWGSVAVQVAQALRQHVRDHPNSGNPEEDS